MLEIDGSRLTLADVVNVARHGERAEAAQTHPMADPPATRPNLA